MLEDTGAQTRMRSAAAPVQLPVFIDENSLTGGHIVKQGKTQYIKRDTLRGYHVLLPGLGLACTNHQRPNTRRVTEAENAIIHQ